ncbi:MULTISPECIES: hybrid sensor histidine kinase/response regulator [Ramlibacter]|uniref:histidine kinase n=1 Tax=Ramlibacter aquaticus TaxID=2780094 RepID=A0ABR9SDU9_9BURK|nr:MULTISPECIES: hybrid sensor histidine kinase/response regulator [Ramlibacter]MBE7940526.1 hybrid sensor histidine kinase/response regulator [Ramlibacter aquaticus]
MPSISCVLRHAARLAACTAAGAWLLAHAAEPAPMVDAEWRAWRMQVLQRAYADAPALARESTSRYAAALAAGDLHGRVRAASSLWAAKAAGPEYEPGELGPQADATLAAVRASGDSRLLFDILDVQANLALARLDLDRADAVVAEQEGLVRQLGDPARTVETLQSRGFVASLRGDLAGSLAVYQQALDSAVDDLHRANLLLAMAGSAEWLQSDPDSRNRRIQWVRHALELAPPERYPYFGIQANYRIVQLLRLSNPALAVETARQGLALALRTMGPREPAAVFRLALARALLAANQPDEAIAASREALPHVEEPEFRNGAYGLLALAYAQKAQPREAMAWLARSEQLMAGPLKGWARGQEDLELLRSQVAAALGQWQPAYAAATRARELADQNLRQAASRQAQFLEARFDARIRERENEFLRAQQATQETGRQLLSLGLAAAFLAALGFGLLAVRQARQKRTLQRLGAEVEQQNRALQAVHDSRTRLLAAACHDLRQPAHALGLLAELAAGAPDALEREHKLDGIRRCSGSLTDMLGTLMDLTRLEGRNYEPQQAPLSLDDLVHDAQLQFSALAAQKGLRLQTLPCGLWVRSDRHLLRRILLNLVSNAVRYTRSGGVTVAVRPLAPGRVVLEVRDTGPGIPADRLPEVFGEFVRLDSKVEEGLGIGLPIVQRAATLLSHPLHVSSDLGVGSCFGVELPLCDAQTEAPPGRAAPLGTAQHQRVLLLDDDAESLAASAALMRQWGFDVRVAPDAAQAEALALREGGAPDLLVTDLHIEGGMDGLQAVERLRQRWPGLRALLVTGDLDAQVVSRAAALGVPVGYKPLSPGRLRARVRDALAQPVGPLQAQDSAGMPLR